jgi:hypothetical protein
MQRKPHLPLPALAADAGARRATYTGAFRGAHIVAIEAGNGKGLEDVEFDALAFERIFMLYH